MTPGSALKTLAHCPLLAGLQIGAAAQILLCAAMERADHDIHSALGMRTDGWKSVRFLAIIYTHTWLLYTPGYGVVFQIYSYAIYVVQSFYDSMHKICLQLAA